MWLYFTSDKIIQTPEQRAGLEIEIKQELSRIKNESVLKFYMEDFANRMKKEFSKIAKTPKVVKPKANPENPNEKMILAFAITYPSLFFKFLEEGKKITLHNPVYKKIFDCVISEISINPHTRETMMKFLESKGFNPSVLLKFEIDALIKKPDTAENIIREKILNLHKENLQFEKGELTKQALLLALNEKPEEVLENREKTGIENVYNLPSKEVSAERAWISIPGKIEKIIDLSESENQNIKDIFPRTQVGNVVNFPLNNVEKCGNVISNHKDYKIATSSAEEKISNLILCLEKNNSETLAFLQDDLETDFPPSAFSLPKDVYNEVKNLPQILENLEIPQCLLPYAENLKDYNHRTIKQTLDIFKKITKFDINQKINFADFKINFWHGLVRGGLQGILYLYENK